MNMKKILTSVAVTIAITSGAASALVLDFTSSATGTSGELSNGVTWSLTANGGALNSSQVFDGAATPATSADDLAFDLDGVGVGDDELSNSAMGIQELVLSFSEPTAVSGFAFLDLFLDQSAEAGMVSADDGSMGVITAQNTVGVNGGFAELFSSITASQFIFSVDNTNDGVGVADGALAAVYLAPVPLPAGGLLLLGALGGLGIARRRKKS